MGEYFIDFTLGGETVGTEDDAEWVRTFDVGACSGFCAGVGSALLAFYGDCGC